MSKKTFTAELNQSPATAFISMPQEGLQEPIEERTGDNREITELFTKHKGELEKLFKGEKKSRHVNLLLKPSIHERLKERATETGESVNNLINELLEKALEGGGAVNG